ncbi:YfhD family protein [bacterium LRH843]|nr:YfhD family protein [bacterium LRH843]
MGRDNPNNQKDNMFTPPQKQQVAEGTDIEFSEEFIDPYEKVAEARSQEKRKGIQSIAFYRNG